jgi:hypothetical protein
MLDRVTITGADDNTDILEMLDLALSYPWLEFGILVSRSREGSPRYPSRQWQEQLLKSAHRMNLSMHVCGHWARSIFPGTVDWAELPPIRTVAQRIQINGPVPVDLDALGACNPGTQFIVQYPRAASYLHACQAVGINCAPLFDESGGEGRQVRAWSDIPDCDYVGYAGGIGPDDVKETVGSIMTFRQGPFWIDSEGRMRDDQDRLDMRKVNRHLEVCEGIINAPAFSGLMEAAVRREQARRKA